MTHDHAMEPGPTPSHRLRGSWPYLAWDAVLALVAVMVLLAFILVEDGRSAFWNGYGVQTSATMLSGLALLISVRLRVPNFAVAGLAVFASSASVSLAGDEASAPVLLAIAGVIGALVGLAMAVIVVGLRVPAWGATLGCSLLLAALATEIIDPGDPRLLRGGSTLVDLGLGVLLMVSIATIAVSLTLFLLARPGSLGDALADDGTIARRGTDIGLQAAALVVSSTLAAVAGMLFVLRVGFADGRIGNDFIRVLAVVLLAGVSLRGFGAGVLALASAAVIVETLTSWTFFLDTLDASYQLLIPAVLGVVGLVIGGVLELLARRSSSPSAP